MAKPDARELQGMIVCVVYEKDDSFEWVDPKSNQVKPLRSLKVRFPHGDGTVTRESIAVTHRFDSSSLQPETAYAFPVVATVNKKGRLNFTLRQDIRPFPAPMIP
jgi:hypothetical protein